MLNQTEMPTISPGPDSQLAQAQAQLNELISQIDFCFGLVQIKHSMLEGQTPESRKTGLSEHESYYPIMEALSVLGGKIFGLRASLETL